MWTGLEGRKVSGTPPEQDPAWPHKAPSPAQQTRAGRSSPGDAAKLKPRKPPEWAAQEQHPVLRPDEESMIHISPNRWSHFGDSPGNYLQGHALETKSCFPCCANSSLAVSSDAASHCQRQPRGQVRVPAGSRQSSKLEGGSTRNIHAFPIGKQPTMRCLPTENLPTCSSNTP